MFRAGNHQYGPNVVSAFISKLQACNTTDILPEALHGRGAAYFGFTTELDSYMTTHNGALIDFGEFVALPGLARPIQTNSWPIGPECESNCHNFRKLLAPGVKLAIGMTPLPVGTAPRNSQECTIAALRQWNLWMQADLILSNLPAVLPTPCFSSSGHLNLSGQKLFTAALAQQFHPNQPR